MKYIILCDNYSLQFIQCRHIIEYILESIPSNEIFIIYNIFLDEHNFQEILINKCRSKNIHFAMIDYQTRGNVETAFVGMNKFIDDGLNNMKNKMKLNDITENQYHIRLKKNILSLY